jgi:dTDP-4-amino-4,6-dideoxygalactose transaminase
MQENLAYSLRIHLYTKSERRHQPDGSFQQRPGGRRGHPALSRLHAGAASAAVAPAPGGQRGGGGARHARGRLAGPGRPGTGGLRGRVASATGFPHILATASGTAALHLGYRLLDVQPGDEVWVPAMTFVATVAPAVQMGARPRFLDVSQTGWTLDPGLLAEELARAAGRGRLPRVVVPVDLYGQCCDLDAIVAACDRWGVPVMCDSAAAMGAMQRGGRHAGRGARLAAFSFNGNKIVTSGGGGALAARIPRWSPAPATSPGRRGSRGRTTSMRRPAMPTACPRSWRRWGWRSWRCCRPGWRGGAPSSRPMPRRLATCRASASSPSRLGPRQPWLTVALVDPAGLGMDREQLRRALEAAGIESRPAWKPLHLQPAFRDAPQAGGAVAAALFERGLCLPSGSGMSPADQARVIDAVRACARG